MDHKYQPINTFSHRPSITQIISYVVISLEIVIFYVMIMNSFVNPITKTVFIVIFSCSTVTVITTGIYCSVSDPSDNTMIAFKNGDKDKFSSRITELLYCDYCDSYVEVSSRHCRQCRRCVQNFDHHCIWINNCIGSKNYKPFIAMIVSTWSQLLIFLLAVLMLSLENQWTQFLGYIITSWVVSFFVLILMILLVNLILLHIYLICNGYTTYQFIIARREQQRLKELEQKQKKAAERLRKKIENERKALGEKPKTRQMIEEQVFQQSNQGQGVELHEESSNFHSNKNITPLKSNRHNPEKTKPQTFNQSQTFETTNQALKAQHPDQQISENVKEFNENIFQQQSNQKSETMSIKIEGVDDQDNKNSEAHIDESHNQISVLANKPKLTQRKETDQFIENTDSEDQKLKMSQFFTRNKSLNFLLGPQVATKPKKKNHLNCSLHVSHFHKKNEKEEDVYRSQIHKSSSYSNEHTLKRSLQKQQPRIPKVKNHTIMEQDS